MFDRIRGLVKAKALHEQVAGMEKDCRSDEGQQRTKLSTDCHQLKQRIDQLIHEITVSVTRDVFHLISSAV